MDHLIAATTTMGITLDDLAVERFARYRALLLAANAQFNVTRVTDPAEIETRLFANSLTLLPLIPQGAARLLDIGSGGGVPGLALAIARPELRVDLLDATGKKARFLADTAQALGLERVTSIQGRAEELARDPAHREAYDIVTARAVARLVTLAELALPFVKHGGLAVLPKGGGAAEELAEARYAIGMLGGRARALVKTPFEGTLLVVLDKVKRTAPQFPRHTGVPSKAPLLGPRNTAA